MHHASPGAGSQSSYTTAMTKLDEEYRELMKRKSESSIAKAPVPKVSHRACFRALAHAGLHLCTVIYVARPWYLLKLS